MPLANALGQLGLRRGMVVSATVGEGRFADELSCSGDNDVAAFGDLELDKTSWKPEDFGLARCSLDDLAGGDRQKNKAIFAELLKGNSPQGLEDTIAWNAGTALWIAGRAKGVSEGIDLARTVLTKGRLAEWVSLAQGVFKS